MREQRYRQCVVRAVENCRPWATRREACRGLRISPRTERHWRQHQNTPLKPRGRPRKTATVGERNQVIRFLHDVTGPALGLPALRGAFPQLPRCILASLLRRYRRVWRYRYRRRGFRLTWHRAGSVWAMDHSQATQLIDGQYEQIFAVRDLASRRQLAWAPVHGTDAAEACERLTDLFSRHGPPLVMKSDQGSAFVAEQMTHLFEQWGVLPLLSPKGTPQYNGALERANSTHKTFTHQQAVQEQHPAYWTGGNLEAARQLANAITRPWGHAGPSPDEAWQRRDLLTAAERDELRRELERQRPLACTELGIDGTTDLTPRQHDRVERRALSAALEQLGYLSKTAVRRPPRRRRPLRGAHLQRALKQQREQIDIECASVTARSDMSFSLASTDVLARMRAVGAGASFTSPAPPTRPARRELAKTQAWRRLIAPVIKLAKAAKITR